MATCSVGKAGILYKEAALFICKLIDLSCIAFSIVKPENMKQFAINLFTSTFTTSISFTKYLHCVSRCGHIYNEMLMILKHFTRCLNHGRNQRIASVLGAHLHLLTRYVASFSYFITYSATLDFFVSPPQENPDDELLFGNREKSLISR